MVNISERVVSLILSDSVKVELTPPMKRKTITLNKNNWIQNQVTGYKYQVYDEQITLEHYMDSALGLANQGKIGNCSIESFDGYYKI